MAKKKIPSARRKTSKPKATKPRSFNGLLRGHAPEVKKIANGLRTLVFEELQDVQESFYGGQRAMSMYRTTADICWIQPLKARCNLYLMRGTELSDDQGILEGSSDRYRFAKVNSVQAMSELPIRQWLQESLSLSEESYADGINFDEVLKRLQAICLALPKTKQTETWGKPHFRVQEKIFCGCGEDNGQPRLGLKIEPRESELMMKLPGIVKAPYSRKGDGWVAVDPNMFDDWEEIERLVVESYRLIAPKRVLALLD